jgi:hypothetical protein
MVSDHGLITGTAELQVTAQVTGFGTVQGGWPSMLPLID